MGKILNNLNDILNMIFFFEGLNKKIKNFGYRIIPLICIIAYFFCLYLSEKFYGSYSFVAKHLILDPLPYFKDLKILLCGIDSIRNQQNPYEAICFDEFAYFNYPIIWGIFAIFPFFTLSNHFQIGFGLIIIFYFLFFDFIRKINLLESIIYSLFIVSPSVVLGLERGNSDIIILILLLLMLYIKNKVIIQSALLLFISILKLYPIGAIFLILVDKVNSNFKQIIFVTFFLLFSLYIFIFFDNISIVSFKTPRPYGVLTYGLGAIPTIAFIYFNEYKNLIFISFISFLLVWLILFYIKIVPYLSKMVVENGVIGKAFFMGSGIFVFTCIIGYNYEYRLVFLLLTLPQIFLWMKQKMILSYLAIVVLLLIVWHTAISNVLNIWKYKYVNTIYVILLFSFFFSFLCHSILLFFKKTKTKIKI
jgi:hypothetical protein